MSEDEIDKIILTTIQICTGLPYGSNLSKEYLTKTKNLNTNEKHKTPNITLREEFENEMDGKGVDLLFKISNINYIKWLEDKINNNEKYKDNN